MGKTKLFLSPGHNELTFDETGAKGGIYPDGRFEEFNFNIAVINELVVLLQPYKEWFEIIQLEFDNNKVDYTLVERIKKINLTGVESDLTIAIHANAGDKEVNGQWGFYASSRGLDFLNIFAKHVKDSLVPYTKHYKCIKETWTSFGIVLNTIPVAVLLELGFFTNDHDRALLRSPTFIKYCASKILASILEYYNIKNLKDDKKTWIELIQATKYPNEWTNNIQRGVTLATEYNIGELDFIKHLPDLIETIGNE